MQLHWPETLPAALDLLARDDARAMSGGATLVAMMNAGLVAPGSLVFLRKIAGLRGITAEADGTIVIGAMTTHADIEHAAAFAPSQDILSEAAGRIAHPPIRAVGTIGGAVAHADPAADYPAALVAADAEIVCTGRHGDRRVAARDFFRDFFETALQPGEIVRAIRLPPSPPGALAVYDKLARVEGDYAIVSLAAVVAVANGVCTHARLASGACGPRPVRSDEAEALLVGSRLDADTAERVGALLAAAADPVDDVRASATYRRKVLQRMARRTIASIRAKALA